MGQWARPRPPGAPAPFPLRSQDQPRWRGIHCAGWRGGLWGSAPPRKCAVTSGRCSVFRRSAGRHGAVNRAAFCAESMAGCRGRGESRAKQRHGGATPGLPHVAALWPSLLPPRPACWALHATGRGQRGWRTRSQVVSVVAPLAPDAAPGHAAATGRGSVPMPSAEASFWVALVHQASPTMQHEGFWAAGATAGVCIASLIYATVV